MSDTACVPVDDESKDGGTTFECSQTETGNAALECSIAELANQRRAQGATCNGTSMPAVGSLALHSILQHTARAHAADMAGHDYFSHTNLSGQSSTDRIEAAGYSYGATGENIAAGSSSPQETMQQWMSSTEGHCENIMSDKFVHIGVGYAYSANTQYEHFWVQNFGAPLE